MIPQVSEDINIPNINVDVRDHSVPADSVNNEVITSQTVPVQISPTALRRSTRIRNPIDRFVAGNNK